MVPTQVREPFHRDGWVYEEKVDGWRILAYKDGDCVRLLSRNGIDHARRFREVVAAVAALSESTLALDREVAIFDQAMRSRFDRRLTQVVADLTWTSRCSRRCCMKRSEARAPTWDSTRADGGPAPSSEPRRVSRRTRYVRTAMPTGAA
jgi:hypothetical protein